MLKPFEKLNKVKILFKIHAQLIGHKIRKSEIILCNKIICSQRIFFYMIVETKVLEWSEDDADASQR